MGLSRGQMAKVMDRVFDECSTGHGDIPSDWPIERFDQLGADKWASIRLWVKSPSMSQIDLDIVRSFINTMVVILCRMRGRADLLEGRPASSQADVFAECRALREAGQKEYAHDDGNAMANFEDDSDATGASRETVLTIFANKHWRGIRAWVNGHRSQRESVCGRLGDMIVYLCLLRGMIDERAGVQYSK